MSRKLNPTQLARLETDVLDECLRIADDIDHETWLRGMTWYRSAHYQARRLAQDTGLDVRTSAAVIAVLSPRIQWSMNVKDAATLHANHDANELAALRSNVFKAWRILAEGEDPDTVLGGRKVRAFWYNIMHPNTSLDVTLDTWMLDALVPERWYAHMQAPYNFLYRLGAYDTVSNGVRKAAEVLGVSPNELQAAIWIHVRGDHE